jgi:hypothetical protein
MTYQKYFNIFNNNIKLKSFADDKDLIEKKNIITNKLTKYLNDNKFENFVFFELGSYSIDTAVKSLNGDYDIDMGLCLDISIYEYEDPVEIKSCICNAFENDDEIEKVEMHRSNILIKYSEGQDKFNVHLSVYTSNNEKDKLYIAKGKYYSNNYNRVWEKVNIEGLQNTINNTFSNEGDKEQFKRIVRYLKRWNNLKLENKCDSSKLGFGITMLALSYFSPVKVDCGEEIYEYDDLNALKILVNRIIEKFETVCGEEEEIERLFLNLPVEPKNDVFNNISDFHMYEFKKELIKVSQLLNEVQQEDEINNVCMLLQSIFGQEFPFYNKCSINVFDEHSITI